MFLHWGFLFFQDTRPESELDHGGNLSGGYQELPDKCVNPGSSISGYGGFNKVLTIRIWIVCKRELSLYPKSKHNDKRNFN